MHIAESDMAEAAYAWVKAHDKEIIARFVTSQGCLPDSQPTTLFMAGSPGAGKTEISKRLLARFNLQAIRIDADEIRSMCPGYLGSNAHIFQKAAVKGVHILYDYALVRDINVILDGTFAYVNALENIERSLKHNRKVEIFFIYQDPVQAWEFTKKREEIEMRRVSKDIFIDASMKARANVNKAKDHFGSKVELNLIIKDFEKDLEQLELNIVNIDPYIKKQYTKIELEDILK